MLSQKKVSAKELFESIKIKRLESEHRTEETRDLLTDHFRKLKGEKAEEKISEQTVSAAYKTVNVFESTK